MRRRRSLRTASAAPEARCTLQAGRTIQLRSDAKDTQTTALPGSHHAIAARARPPSPPFQNVDAPPAAVRPPPSPPWSVYHSLSIVPVDAVTPPEGHGPPASGLRAPRRRAHRAPPGHRRAPGGLPARGGGGRRRRGPAAVRRARVPGVSDVRRVRRRSGAVSVRGLRARAPGTVLVQRAGVVSQLWWSPDDGARRPPRGRGAAVGAGAAVGPDGAVSAPVPDGVESRTEPRGAAGVPARAAQRVRARRPGVRRAGWTHRQRHRAAARRQRVERESALSHPRAGRGVHRSARGRASVSSGAGTDRRRGRGGAGDDPPPGAAAAGAPRGPRQAHLEGFDLHANVWVPANDRAGVERLCRYVLRPPFELELKRAWHDGTRELVFEPLEFLERLAAMTPRPETNLLICHGVLAPRARWRARVVAYGRRVPEPTASTAPLATGPDGTGVKTASPHAWSWAALMHRAFGIDVLACPQCGGRLRLIATLHDPAVIRKILAHCQ